MYVVKMPQDEDPTALTIDTLRIRSIILMEHDEK
jgi:hypothetical protein